MIDDRDVHVQSSQTIGLHRKRSVVDAENDWFLCFAKTKTGLNESLREYFHFSTCQLTKVLLIALDCTQFYIPQMYRR